MNESYRKGVLDAQLESNSERFCIQNCCNKLCYKDVEVYMSLIWAMSRENLSLEVCGQTRFKQAC